MYEEAVAASGEIPTRLGGNAGPAELDVWRDVGDVDVDAAEGVDRDAPVLEPAGTLAMGQMQGRQTRTTAKPCHSGCRCRRGADSRFGVAVFCSCGAFLALAFLGVTPTDARNAARKSSVSRCIGVSFSPWATTSSGAVAAKGVLEGTPVTTWMMPMPLLEGVETRTRSRACGDACDQVEDAAAGEGEETLTRTRLEADARLTGADEGEAIVDVDVVGVPTWSRFGVAVLCSCGAFRARDFLASLHSKKAHKHSSIKK